MLLSKIPAGFFFQLINKCNSKCSTNERAFESRFWEGGMNQTIKWVEVFTDIKPDICLFNETL